MQCVKCHLYFVVRVLYDIPRRLTVHLAIEQRQMVIKAKETISMTCSSTPPRYYMIA